MILGVLLTRGFTTGNLYVTSYVADQPNRMPNITGEYVAHVERDADDVLNKLPDSPDLAIVGFYRHEAGDILLGILVINVPPRGGSSLVITDTFNNTGIGDVEGMSFDYISSIIQYNMITRQRPYENLFDLI